ncbi:MAG TPA: hypothetical protein VJ755_08090 [Gemmatimonadales bacterium]|nr:hypothetical protein [Gemmatimonadales bacterium]
MNITHRILLATPATLLIVACGATEPNAMAPVNLSAAIAGAPAGSGSARNLIVSDQNGSVSISSAQMVLSRIQLANNQPCTGGSAGSATAHLSDVLHLDDDAPGDTLDDDDGDGESSDTTDVDDDDGEADDDDEAGDTLDVDNDSPSAAGCVPLQTGQVLVNLPLDGATKAIVDALVPAGTYTRLQANLQSVEVAGVFTDANGTDHPFTLTPRLNAVTNISLDAPLTVDASTAQLILDVIVRSWFTDGSGAVLDPTRAANQRVLERNIRSSLRARS